MRKSFQIRPDVEARDPLRDDVAGPVAEWNTHDLGVAGPRDPLARLVAGGLLGFGNQSGDHEDLRIDIDPLFLEPLVHLFFECPGLIQDIDHLPTRVGHPEDVRLTEVAMRREDYDAEDHRNPGQELFENIGAWSLENGSRFLCQVSGSP